MIEEERDTPEPDEPSYATRLRDGFRLLSDNYLEWDGEEDGEEDDDLVDCG